tara:strand:- start:138 stop:347 length:210 start_codon:yes stop_codon:yes gene_type:complete
MKSFLRIFTILTFSLNISSEVVPITNYQLNKICKEEKREKYCLKRLKNNRELIEKGKPIEIPVIPFKNR